MSIIVGTRDGLHEIAPRRHTHLEGRAVTSLAWDGPQLWAVTDGNTIWRGPDDWEEVATTGDVGARCILPSTIGLLVGTSDGRVMRLDGSTLVPLVGFDRVEGRDKWWQVGGLDTVANTRSLAQAPDGTLYANIHVGGIYRSRDLGSTWEPTIDQETDVHEIKALADGLVLAATGMAGLCVSKDAGDNWDSITDGLPTSSGWGLPYARSIARWGDVIIMTASNGPTSDEAGVYRGRLHSSAPLERCGTGLPETFRDNIDTGCLSVGGGVAAFGTTEGSVFASRDAGESWDEIARDLPPVLCVQAA
ncbi:MAG: hypothetical protein WD296_07365 [Acidimicrobiia bacterium]